MDYLLNPPDHQHLLGSWCVLSLFFMLQNEPWLFNLHQKEKQNPYKHHVLNQFWFGKKLFDQCVLSSSENCFQPEWNGGHETTGHVGNTGWPFIKISNPCGLKDRLYFSKCSVNFCLLWYVAYIWPNLIEFHIKSWQSVFTFTCFLYYM